MEHRVVTLILVSQQLAWLLRTLVYCRYQQYSGDHHYQASRGNKNRKTPICAHELKGAYRALDKEQRRYYHDEADDDRDKNLHGYRTNRYRKGVNP